MSRLVAALIVLALCMGPVTAATVGYVTYGGLENPAVNDDDAWVKAMRQAGLTVELVRTTDLPDAELLGRFNALYIPGTIAFTEAGFSALQRYVRAGGWLLLDGYYSATALDTSGRDIYVGEQATWKIIRLEEGTCRTGILPATGAGAAGTGVKIAALQLTPGDALTAGAKTGTLLDMPLRRNRRAYPCSVLHCFAATGARPLIVGTPEAAEGETEREPRALAVYNEYGKGKSLWVGVPLADMAAAGVDFAVTITGNISAAMAANVPPPAEELARVIPTVDEAMADLKAHDIAFRGGKGQSDSPDSNELGWGEASRLLMYFKAYGVSQDTYWLDKIVDHFDRMIGTLSDPDGDGYLGWGTTAYTDALGWPTAAKDNQGDATIEPELVRARNNKQVTGHTYVIEFTSEDKFSVTDTSAGAPVAGDEAYKSGQQIAAIPGIKVTIAGKPAKGDIFEVRTEMVTARESVCHDGVITYPIALFVEAVKKNEALHERYGEKADQYADLLQDHFLKKWEHVWLEPAEGLGVMKWEPLVANPYLRDLPPAEIPNTVRPIPHNQYLALARTYLVMADVPGEPEAAHYRDVAEKMARYFKSKLRKTGQAYTFAYTDPLEGLSEGADDVSHGGLSLTFCIEAAKRGVIFTEEDMNRFSHTLLDQVWNGSLEDPKFSRRVNGEGNQSSTGIPWPGLCRYNDELWKLSWAIFRQKPSAGGFLGLWHARPEAAQDPPAARTGP